MGIATEEKDTTQVPGWREKPSRDISGRTPAIVRELEKATVEIARLVEEGEPHQAEIERERWEAEYERWRREEEARRAAKALKDSKEELLPVIDTWAEAKRLEAFFADAERRIYLTRNGSAQWSGFDGRAP